MESLKTKAFQESLRRLREALGITQADLATRCGTQPAAVSHWESGRRLPTLGTLYGIRDALGCSWNALLGSPDGAMGVNDDA